MLGSTRLSEKAIKTSSTLSQRTAQLQPQDRINLRIMMSSSLVFSIYFFVFCVASALLLWLVREIRTNQWLIGPLRTGEACSRDEWMGDKARKMHLLNQHITMVVRREPKERLQHLRHLRFIISGRT